jgi:argininosuccinate lyase
MHSALLVAAGIVGTAKFRADRIAQGLDRGFLDATALAEYLVNKGVAFRTAHQVVGSLVAQAEKMGKSLSELPLATLRQACEKIDSDVFDSLTPANVVKNYAPPGAGGHEQLKEQLAYWDKAIQRA